ncbi:MAG: cupin domain-containing protein [Candidatus ainarchaeum sp.]|nr:cupin domain-containing protein [Candidatus ainarchaeum sp.]
MKKYIVNQDGWFCGHWNNSPLQIKYSENRPLKIEDQHSHKDFAEYFLVLKGSLTLEVGSKNMALKKLDLLMIEKNEFHRIIKKSKCCSYVVIKEKSYANNKA